MSDVTTGWTSDPEESWSNGWDEAERHVRETEVKPLAQRHAALVEAVREAMRCDCGREDCAAVAKLRALLASEPVTP